MKESTDDKALQEVLLPDDDSSSDENIALSGKCNLNWALDPHLVKMGKMD